MEKDKETKTTKQKALVVKPVKDLEKRNPEDEIKFATLAAKSLKDVIVNNQRATLEVGGKQYLYFEDWQMLGRFFKYTVGTDWTKPIEKNGVVRGYEARAIVYNQEGITLGSAEAMCLRDERTWSSKPEFQLKSMAQTRATAKALRNVLAWVMVLAGYEPTPAEEMQEKSEELVTDEELISVVEFKPIKEMVERIEAVTNQIELDVVRTTLTDMDKSAMTDIQIKYLHRIVDNKKKELNAF